jgi:hypothetical protein
MMKKGKETKKAVSVKSAKAQSTARARSHAGQKAKVKKRIIRVPLKPGQVPRIDGRPGKPNDVRWHPAFLEVLAKTSNVAAACRAVKIDWHTAQEHRQKFEDFRLLWHECEQMGVEELHAVAVDHALNGTKKPVFQGGVEVGEILEFDHRLLEWLLQRKRPAEFGDKKEIAVKESVMTLEDLQPKLKASAALRETLGKMLAEAGA